MLSVQIDDVKNFMKKLLMDTVFDDFLLMQARITTYNTFEIDGRIEKDFFGTEYDSSPLYGYEFTPWSISKSHCLSIIKGKYTPVSFKFIMYADRSLSDEILKEVSAQVRENVQYPVLSLRYDQHGLFLTTGLATHSFMLDKTAEESWDRWVRDFLGRYELN